MLKKTILLGAAAIFFLASGCASKVYNNHLAMGDFANHLQKSGFEIEQVQPLNPGPVKAVEGMAVKFKNNPNEIGVYRYDTEKASDVNRLNRYKEEGCMYIVGFKYPVLVQGSFAVIGFEKNQLKHQIIEAVSTFE